MEELQVSEGGITHKLPRPFFVIATQNNIEHAGTYQLPEAQMDRFLMRVRLGYPNQEQEIGRVYTASGRCTTYVGDWHSHPGGSLYLS